MKELEHLVLNLSTHMCLTVWLTYQKPKNVLIVFSPFRPPPTSFFALTWHLTTNCEELSGAIRIILQ